MGTSSASAERGAPTTIRDIAEVLGVSHATVSRALAGHSRISEATQARVRAAALDLGYVVNASARATRLNQSKVVGLVIADIQNDFYASVAKGVADLLAAEGFQLVLSVTEDDPDREMRDVRALVEARAAAVIITPSARPRGETISMLNRVRTVQLVRRHPRFSGDAVAIDDRKGTYTATKHLLDLGHRRIAFIGASKALSSGAARLLGFVEALDEAGQDSSLAWLGVPRPDFARHAIGKMLRVSPRPTGLVLGSSELTLGALQRLQAAAIRIPEDLSMVGYGDPAWFSLVGGGITSVSLPVNEIAALVTNCALATVTEGAWSAESMTVSPGLVVRSSSCRL